MMLKRPIIKFLLNLLKILHNYKGPPTTHVFKLKDFNFIKIDLMLANNVFINLLLSIQNTVS